MNKELYSTEDICYMLCTNEKQIRYWVYKGYLKPFSNSKKYRFTRKAIDDFLKLGESHDLYGVVYDEGRNYIF